MGGDSICCTCTGWWVGWGVITPVALAHLVDATLQSQDGGILIEVHVESQQPKLVEAARTLAQATVKKGKQDRK